MRLQARQALVIDDDDASNSSTTQWLSDFGFAPTVAKTAEHGAEALGETFDVVLLNLELPDRHGYSLLFQIRRGLPSLPVIVTSGDPSADVLRVWHLGAVDFLRKPYHADDLLRAIDRAQVWTPLGDQRAESPQIPRTPVIEPVNERPDSRPASSKPARPEPGPAPASASATPTTRPRDSNLSAVSPEVPRRDVATVKRFRTLIASGEASLPVMDPRIASLQRFISGDDFTMADVAGVVTGDTALTAGVLRMANSAYFSRGEIDSVIHACQRLGTSRVVGIALEVAVQGQFRHSLEPFRSLLHESWRNSVVTALVARELGPACKIKDRDRLHVAGLLHNIGEPAGVLLYADASQGTQEIPIAQIGIDLAALHEDIGHEIATAWALPSYVVRLAGNHHRAKRGESPKNRNLRQVILAAWTIAIKAGYTYLPDQDASELDYLVRDLEVSPKVVATILDAIPSWEI